MLDAPAGLSDELAERGGPAPTARTRRGPRLPAPLRRSARPAGHRPGALLGERVSFARRCRPGRPRPGARAPAPPGRWSLRAPRAARSVRGRGRSVPRRRASRRSTPTGSSRSRPGPASALRACPHAGRGRSGTRPGPQRSLLEGEGHGRAGDLPGPTGGARPTILGPVRPPAPEPRPPGPEGPARREDRRRAAASPWPDRRPTPLQGTSIGRGHGGPFGGRGRPRPSS